MSATLRILLLEDRPADAELVLRELRKEGIEFTAKRVMTEADFLTELRHDTPDLILADYMLPAFNGLAALALAKKERPEIPFILVSGSLGEEAAIDSMHHGATDYVLKQRLARLGPAVRRALREAKQQADRHRFEQQIRLQATALESVANSIMITDPQGAILSVNDAFTATTGYAVAEVIGKTPRILKSGQQDAAFYEHLWKTITSGQVWRGEVTNRRKDGQHYIEEMTITPLRDSQGTITHYVATKQDITERKQNESQIRRQAQLLDLAPDAIYVWDNAGRVLFWNQGANRLTGCTAQEALGQEHNTLWQLDAVTVAAAQKALHERGEWQGEIQATLRTGLRLTLMSRWLLLRDAQGQPEAILSINTDITEKKKLESQFLRAQRLESIGSLASGIAHDLNNILAPTLIALPMLREGLPPDELDQTLNLLEECTQRGANIIKQLLTFGRGLTGERVALQLKHQIKDMVKIARETFPRNIQVLTKIPTHLWSLQGDPTQMHQVLLNLCINARDAMPEGGVLTLTADNLPLDEQRAAMEPEAKPGPYVLLEVSDTGAGISPEHLDKIFDPFFTTKELGKGTGLGLATVLGIVKSHGGFIKVQSTVGRGTVFQIFLPATPEAPAVAVAASPPTLPRGQGETILVVEDELSVREVTQKTLTKCGYQVLTAADGIEAVALFAQKGDTIRLVLTDLLMPNLDGLALARALRRMAPRLPIILCSGVRDGLEESKQTELRTLGIKTILAKPYSAEVLLTVLHDTFHPGHSSFSSSSSSS